MASRFDPVNLEHLISSHDFVIFDTCAITERWRENFSKCRTHYEAFDYAKNTLNFEQRLNEKVAGGSNIYITSGVYNEIVDVKPYSVKKTAKMDDGKLRKSLVPISRAIRESRKTLRKLTEAFLDNNRILNFKNAGNKDYEKLSDRYIHLKDKLELSETDFDIIVSGLYLKEAGESTAVLTNDNKICEAGYAILFGGNISPKNLDFFIRSGFNQFKEFFIPKARLKLLASINKTI